MLAAAGGRQLKVWLMSLPFITKGFQKMYSHITAVSWETSRSICLISKSKLIYYLRKSQNFRKTSHPFPTIFSTHCTILTWAQTFNSLEKVLIVVCRIQPWSGENYNGHWLWAREGDWQDGDVQDDRQLSKMKSVKPVKAEHPSFVTGAGDWGSTDSWGWQPEERRSFWQYQLGV